MFQGLRRLRFGAIVLVATLLSGPSTTVQAQTDECPPPCATATPPAAPDFSGCCWCRPKLTGDWGGCRTDLACNGITFDADETLFFAGVANGGLNQQFRFAGHGDYVLNVDGGKAWGCEGLFVKLRAEHRYGQTVDGDAGVFLPPTLAADLPLPNSDKVCLTDVLFTQALSEQFAVFAGKLDTLDADANAYASGRGKTQFSNIGFVVDPAMLRIVPYSTLGAGFIVLQDLHPLFSFMVMNAQNTIDTSGFEDLFGEGAVLAGELRLPTKFADLPGHQTFGGCWSSRNFVSLGQDPRIILPDVPIARQSGSWALYWNFDQALIVDACNPQRHWGVFGRASVADDQANPLESFLSFGIGGSAPWGSRPADTFGVGWYKANTSDKIGPFLSQAFGPIGDGQAVEIFYNYEVSPWCHVTPDLQVLIPARENVDTSLFLGVRMKIDF